jgi:hypothetical protein
VRLSKCRSICVYVCVVCVVCVVWEWMKDHWVFNPTYNTHWLNTLTKTIILSSHPSVYRDNNRQQVIPNNLEILISPLSATRSPPYHFSSLLSHIGVLSIRASPKLATFSHVPNCKIVVGFKMIDHRSWDRMDFWDISQWNAYYAYGRLFLDFFENRCCRIVYTASAWCCLLIMINTYFKEPFTVLALMFYHFEPYNDFAIRCV